MSDEQEFETTRVDDDFAPVDILNTFRNDPKLNKVLAIYLNPLEEVGRAEQRMKEIGLLDAVSGSDIKKAQSILEEVQPHTYDWYMLNIYNAFQSQMREGQSLISMLKNKDKQVQVLMRYSFQLGAIWREYLLSDAHRKTVEDQKKSTRRLGDAGKAENAQRRAKAEMWRGVARRVASQSHLTGAALEDKINRELKSLGFRARAGRTIRDALKKRVT